MGEDFVKHESMVGRNEPAEELCPFLVLLLLPFRLWPAKRVSGDAVRRGVEPPEAIGDARAVPVSAVEDFGLLRTSFNEVFCPRPATCQGEAGLLSSLLSEIWGLSILCCMICCCFLRSFCDNFKRACLFVASS